MHWHHTCTVGALGSQTSGFGARRPALLEQSAGAQRWCKTQCRWAVLICPPGQCSCKLHRGGTQPQVREQLPVVRPKIPLSKGKRNLSVIHAFIIFTVKKRSWFKVLNFEKWFKVLNFDIHWFTFTLNYIQGKKIYHYLFLFQLKTNLTHSNNKRWRWISFTCGVIGRNWL